MEQVRTIMFPGFQLPLVLARKRERLLAFLIDVLPITAVVFGLAYLFFGFDTTLHEYLQRNGDLEPRATFIQERNTIRLIATVLLAIYGGTMEGTSGDTFGKRALGLHVVDLQGSPITMKQASARNLGKLFSMLPAFVVFIWMLFDKKVQGLHDRAAGTLVLKRTSSVHRS
jgi:uncharacterized RDD family membrane protein YckC